MSRAGAPDDLDDVDDIDDARGLDDLAGEGAADLDASDTRPVGVDQT